MVCSYICIFLYIRQPLLLFYHPFIPSCHLHLFSTRVLEEKSTMKFVLLISMLAVGGIFAKSYEVSVEGTIKCNEPFMYNMRIFELDKYKHDFVAAASDTSQNSEKKYRIAGKASDMLQSQVEPLFFFWHNCGFGGKGDGMCHCMDLGNISKDHHLKLDIDFNEKDALKGFRRCKQACRNALGGDHALYGGM